MKKYVLLFAFIFLFVGNTPALAQSTTTPGTTTPIIISPGLTPDSTFYFLDKFIEKLQEALTFGSDAKAKLQIKFAAERVAEIKAMINSGGVNDPGISEAQARLKEHTKQANDIIKSEKDSGKDVTELEDELKSSVDENDNELENVSKQAEVQLHEQTRSLEQAIHEAEQTGDKTKIEALKQQIKDAELNAENAKKQAERTRESLKEGNKIEGDSKDNNESDSGGDN